MRIAVVGGFFQPIQGFIHVICFLKMITSDSIHCHRVAAFSYCLQIWKIIRVLFQLFVVKILAEMKFHGRKIDPTCHLHNLISNGFEFFIRFQGHFFWHDIRIGSVGFALKPIPKLVHLCDFFVLGNDFYDIIDGRFRFFIEITVYLFSFVVLQSFCKHGKFEIKLIGDSQSIHI